MKTKINKGVSIILINKKDELLLHLRGNNTNLYPEYWALISGHVEKNENSLTAIKREIKEEIDCKVYKIKKLSSIFAPKNYKLFIYMGKINKPVKNINLYEGKKIEYFEIDKIKNLHMPYFLKKFIFSNKDKILNFNKN